jgi:hypothetical protein
VEWLFDVVAILACVIPALWWMRGRIPPLPRLGLPLLGWACVVMVLALAGLVALRRLPANGGRWRRWLMGVRILHEPRRFGAVAAYSLLVSLLTALSAWLALVAFGVPLSWTAASLLLGLISLGGLVPTPGAVGGFHAVCQWGLVTLCMIDRVSTVLPVIGLHAILYLPAAAIGALCFLWQRRVPTRIVGAMVAALVVATPLAAQGVPGAATGLEPDASLSAADIFSRMVQRNAARAARVQAYDSIRRYTVFEPGHEPDAELVVSMRWESPATKIFVTTSERGVGWIHKRIFRGLINAEIEAATGAEHRHSDIVPDNYHAELIGTDRWRGRACYLLALTPTRRDKYLFRGTAWIDTEDYAMAKLEAEPAKSPSFWVIRAPFVREYQRLDGFWLPVHDETHPQVRFVGDYTLRIEYAEYHITSRD